jgi:hypothetical protein
MAPKTGSRTRSDDPAVYSRMAKKLSAAASPTGSERARSARWFFGRETLENPFSNNTLIDATLACTASAFHATSIT